MIPYDSWHYDAANESTEESIPSIERTAPKLRKRMRHLVAAWSLRQRLRRAAAHRKRNVFKKRERESVTRPNMQRDVVSIRAGSCDGGGRLELHVERCEKASIRAMV